jgi:hypothetical protein
MLTTLNLSAYEELKGQCGSLSLEIVDSFPIRSLVQTKVGFGACVTVLYGCFEAFVHDLFVEAAQAKLGLTPEDALNYDKQYENFRNARRKEIDILFFRIGLKNVCANATKPDIDNLDKVVRTRQIISHGRQEMDRDF